MAGVQVTFLGTGTSHGVPVIGCDCDVCRSPDPRNRRTRSSLYVQSADGNAALFDVGPEFRIQALSANLRRVDAVFLTHGHADHILGIDDLRRINELQGGAVPVWGSAESLAAVRRSFAYVFDPGPPGPTCPRIELFEFDSGRPIRVGGLSVTPLPCRHGSLDIHGFLVEADGGRVGYFPDCNGLPIATIERLRGIDLLILDGLRPEPHPTHFSLSESLAAMAVVGARRAYITHICHRLEHEATRRILPEGVGIPWDGLRIEVGRGLEAPSESG